MNSLQKSGGSSNEEEEGMLLAMQLCGIELIAYAVKTARELDLLETMAKARPLGIHLSTLYLASKAAPNNPDAPVMIDRLLRLLVAYSVCTCKLVKDEKGKVSRTYGLGNVGNKFIKNEHGISIAPYVLFHCSHTKGVTWSYLTESILEGGASAWEKAKGALVFECMKENESLKEDFNESMMSHTTIVMNKILENYNEFESLRDCTLVDVGGGIGTNLSQVVSKFPHLKGVNFDLPHIVSEAPQIHGVEHIGGDMFDEIPRGQAILMKWILHDWSDEKCVEILRNCKKALPKTGRVIVIETIIPSEVTDTDIATKNALHSDIAMMCLTRGGRERTKEEFEVLAMKAGFKLPNFIYGAYSFWVLELYSN
ncbi:caffeic acid 3-O-methyltransferase [Raphanus sativus]|uniref:Caffeic acid 3-O-methyltransferase n=1 Tax=Raphanus sativus TaxID=3726 RepID=A0A6J0LVT7_RAPSA|nr:caffeic acid 3-O-methyltransferase [Raphanus sativus]